MAEGYKEPTDAAGHAKMAAKIKKILDDTLADRGDRHGNPDLGQLIRAYEYHMKRAKENSQGVAEGSALECPSCHSHDVKTYSDGEKECNDCHKTWEVKGMKESLLQSLVSLVKQSPISEMAASRTAEDLEVGDVVEIAGNVEHQGMTGEIVRFGEGKRFVVVNLYNGGVHSFHSSDVIEADLSHEDEDEDGEENVFWVVFHDEDEEHTWIGKVSREQGTKWREYPHKGKPDYRWGASYMGYLEPHQVMDWIHKDYSRGMQIEGPFFSAEEAEEHARQHFGEINEEKEVCKQCGMEGCKCKPGECNCTPKPGYPKK
jgi:ribosomal protein L37AE/L43A